MTLTAPELGDRQIKKGDEIITVACGFPTTVTPAIQYGAVPVFVDVTVPQYNIDVTKLEAALSEKTKAVMIAHTLGNPFDLSAVKAFCDKHNLWLVEDNCDALGTEYTIDGETRFTGTWGDIGTSSFYPPHHMTMGEGGCVYTNNPQLHRLILSFRDWGRDWVCSDVICYPQRLLHWIQLWLDSGMCNNMVCTIKMQGKIDWPLIAEFAAIKNSKVLHLHYNKHELTWIYHKETEPTQNVIDTL